MNAIEETDGWITNPTTPQQTVTNSFVEDVQQLAAEMFDSPTKATGMLENGS